MILTSNRDPLALRRRVLAAVAAVAVAAGAAGCGSNESAVETRTPGQALTEIGWVAFSEGDLVGASEAFEDAIAVDPLYADAENGLGWVSLFYGLYGDADGHFQKATNLGLASKEAEAGHAIVSELRARHDEALAAATRVLAAEPRFAFSRRDGIDYRDLHLLRARGFVARGKFLEAQAEVDVIDPANNLNSGSETFVDDLLAQIELLGERLYDL